MQQIQGSPAAEGSAVGEVVVFRHAQTDFSTIQSFGNPEDEMVRFALGRQVAADEFTALIHETMLKFGAEKAGIFEGYLEILMDDEVEESMRAQTKTGQSAEASAIHVFAGIAADFASMEGGYMQERAADIIDIGKRLAVAISGRGSETLPQLTKPCVLVVDDLSPAETVRLELSYVQGLLVDGGGVTSHVAILARSLNIPCIVGLSDFSLNIKNGERVALDGKTGILFKNPSACHCEEFLERRQQETEQRNRLLEAASGAAITEDGVIIAVRANIGTPEEALNAKQNGAEGVGLFRTEFLYMHSDELPTEEMQYEAYKKALEALDGAHLTIRSFDVGGDKELPAMQLEKEENPFLGYRAIRIGLDRPEVFKPQLKAALRAALHGKAELMLPMIISVNELRAIKALINECKVELKQEGKPFGDKLPVGIMIETPAAALLADELAREADFFSIGSNDLTQYTLAVDRGNAKIAALYNSFHPAVLRLIGLTGDAARRANIPLCMCGEFASDTRATALLIGLGLTELSVSPVLVPLVKDAVRKLNTKNCRALAERVLGLATAEEIMDMLAL